MAGTRFDHPDHEVSTAQENALRRRAAPPAALDAARAYAMLSIAAALVTMALKLGAYFLTNSVGLFSDAAEFGH